MLQILLHSSKTTASRPNEHKPIDTPLFEKDAEKLAAIWRRASTTKIKQIMQISDSKAAQVKELYSVWSSNDELQTPAIDAFKGDIYSGLQTAQWSEADRKYAHEHLVILSGLYGALRACDGIQPYRLEMGYKLPNGESLYSFWNDKLAKIIQPETSCIINLSAVEYTKALLPYITQPVITPKFMTINPETKQPTFVTVHAKIARGAFARWMIQNQIDNPEDIVSFGDLGYRYDAVASIPGQPVFVCDTFQGIGLSVRLSS